MTTRKITTFLMCPAADGDALGGTPAASAASGGHIKKGANWVHAYVAALGALADLIDSRGREDGQDDEDDEEVPDDDLQSEEEGGEVGHRSLLREQADQASKASNSAKHAYEGIAVKPRGGKEADAECEQEVGHSVLRRQHSSQRSADNDHRHQQAQGLEPEIEGGHSLPLVDGWTAPGIAAAADRVDAQRLAVVAVVVFLGRAAAVRARELAGVLQTAEADSASHLVVRLPLRATVEVVDRHGSGRLLRGVDQLGPVLHPVVRAKLLARDLAAEVVLERPAVIRRERLAVLRPLPHIAAVYVPQNAGDLCVVVACELEDLAIGGDWLHGAESKPIRPACLACLDPTVQSDTTLVS